MTKTELGVNTGNLQKVKWKKCETWQGRLLASGGRVTLIQSYLTGIAYFMMSLGRAKEELSLVKRQLEENKGK